MIGTTEEEETLLRGMYLIALKQEVEEKIRESLSGYIGQPMVSSIIIESITAILAEQKKKEVSDVWNITDSTIRALPLEDMPLYVNDENTITQVIAQWRLKIGK